LNEEATWLWVEAAVVEKTGKRGECKEEKNRIENAANNHSFGKNDR